MAAEQTKPKQTRRATRPQEILAAGAELFAERGFAAVGIDEIGQRAGITGPAIYRHFRGKDDILATLFEQALDRLFEATGGEFDEPFDMLDRLVRGHVSFVLDERQLAGVKVREERMLSDENARRVNRRERRYIERWEGCLKRCYPDASAADVLGAALATIGALNSVSSWPPAALRGASTAEVLADYAFGGLALLLQD